jgi:acetyl-CoA carboxylase carboxyl transferase subunit beta
VSWINNVVPPRFRSLLSPAKKDTPDNLWVKCPDSGQLVFHKDLENNLFVVPGSDFHMRMDARTRLATTFDEGRWDEIAVNDVLSDPLRFRDEKRYADKLKEARTKTGLLDAVKLGVGRIEGREAVVAVQSFDFIGGTVGVAAGEAIVTGAEQALKAGVPFVLFAASGGMRMQEGVFSLMQMPRTTVAVNRLKQARLPYIVVLTNPTTGGVTASYAMLGDVHIAEPGALIGFAGPRVIEQTVREKLPEGFQRAEYLRDHGMVDMVVHRRDMRATLARLCDLLMDRRGAAAPALAAE